ncbi:MAG: arginyltransferase [Methylococcaceae bacterium]|nr:arginyltransferase [Methylococcaceae bacterium]
MSSIPLLITPPHPCSYLEDRDSQSAFVGSAFRMNTHLYSKLISHGFRRSGDDVYSPHCQNCSQCVACRIPVAQFKPNRNQKRCAKKNQQTTTIIKAPVFEEEHYQLYMRYQQHKHPESGMATSTREDYIHFLSSVWCKTQFVEFYREEQLVAVAIVDMLDKSLSAVYTFFDPDFSEYSLGIYAVLWQLEYAIELGFDYVYLGFWIAECQKMSYKNQYQPLEGFINQQWQLVEKT